MDSYVDSLSVSQLHQLRTLGYVSLSCEAHRAAHIEQLISNYSSLFEISKRYFALPSDHPAKDQFRAQTGAGASEEGYSKIESEKEIFTCRAANRIPKTLTQSVAAVWHGTGELLENVIAQISEDLYSDTPKNGQAEPKIANKPFQPLIQPCVNLLNERTPTLLRLFRYDRPIRTDHPNTESQIVAEGHRDLGLLSIVVGSSAGLEVLDESTNQWISIEEPRAAQDRSKADRLTITLLGGQTLRFLTRGYYRAGVHRVRVAPKTLEDGSPDPFRYSIVYALRAYPATLNLGHFECQKVGTFTANERHDIDGFPAQNLFKKLMSTHYNINIARDIREKQKLKQEQSTTRPLIFPDQPGPSVAQDERHSVAVARKGKSKSNWLTLAWRSIKKGGGHHSINM